MSRRLGKFSKKMVPALVSAQGFAHGKSLGADPCPLDAKPSFLTSRLGSQRSCVKNP